MSSDEFLQKQVYHLYPFVVLGDAGHSWHFQLLLIFKHGVLHT